MWIPCCFRILAEAPKLIRKSVNCLHILKGDAKAFRQNLLSGNPKHSLATFNCTLHFWGIYKKKKGGGGDCGKVRSEGFLWGELTECSFPLWGKGRRTGFALLQAVWVASRSHSQATPALAKAGEADHPLLGDVCSVAESCWPRSLPILLVSRSVGPQGLARDSYLRKSEGWRQSVDSLKVRQTESAYSVNSAPVMGLSWAAPAHEK